MTKRVIAFVGHSFADEDRAIVNFFTRHLDQMKTAGLDWVDCEPGQSGSVQKKVLGKLESASIFIGILTRKFRLSGASDSRSGRALWSRLAHILRNPEWATSGWTLQESGYSIGQHVDRILLVEGGVSDAGGLQGDAFRIPFSRQNPEKALMELTGQLSSILGKQLGVAPPLETTVSAAPPTPEGEPAPPHPPPARDDASLAYVEMLRALRSDTLDRGKAEAALKRALDKSEDEDEKLFFRTEYGFWRIVAGDATGLDDLETLAKHQPTRRTLLSLADYWASVSEHEKALPLFKAAFAAGASSLSDAIVIGRWAGSLVALHRLDDARSLLLPALNGAPDEESRAALCVGLADVAKAGKDPNEELAWLDYAVSLRPLDHGVRFRLAYFCSERGHKQQSLLHYKQLVLRAPNEANLNNMGVAYSHLGLNGAAVAAYHRAEEEGSTIAMANLTQRLLGAGFYKEADTLIQKAVSHLDHDAHVGAARVRLDELQADEVKKEEAVLERGESQRRFYVEFGGGLLVDPAEAQGAAGIWRSSFGAVAVSVSARQLVGQSEDTGTPSQLKEPTFALIAARLGNKEPSLTRRISVTGEVKGRSGRAKLTKEVFWGPAVVLSPAYWT